MQIKKGFSSSSANLKITNPTTTERRMKITWIPSNPKRPIPVSFLIFVGILSGISLKNKSEAIASPLKLS